MRVALRIALILLAAAPAGQMHPSQAASPRPPVGSGDVAAGDWNGRWVGHPGRSGRWRAWQRRGLDRRQGYGYDIPRRYTPPRAGGSGGPSVPYPFLPIR